MKLYYTDKNKAEEIASDLRCCGFNVETTFDGETYELLVTEK